MRKLKDFETEYRRFKGLLQYAKSLDNFYTFKYKRTSTSYTDAMIRMVFYFKNNYGISIINYGYSYDDDRPFRCALMYDGHITYDEVFEDVFGECDADECKALMLYVSRKEEVIL